MSKEGRSKLRKRLGQTRGGGLSASNLSTEFQNEFHNKSSRGVRLKGNYLFRRLCEDEMLNSKAYRSIPESDSELST